MKTITFIVICAAALFISSDVAADKLMADEYQQRPNPHYDAQYQKPSTVNDVPDRIAAMFLDQGVIGAMLLILGFWFYIFSME